MPFSLPTTGARLKFGRYAVKALRIAQWVILALFAGYVLLLHNANPSALALPFLPALPPAVALTGVALLAWLVGFLPSWWRWWRVQRQLKTVTGQRDELTEALAMARREEPSDAVIPDRRNPRTLVEDPSDHL